jgi:hypothetical protein
MSDQQVNNALLILAFILLIAGWVLIVFKYRFCLPSFRKINLNKL